MSVHPIYQTHSGFTPAVQEVLDVGQYAVLGTVSDEGDAHMTPVMYAFADGAFLFETSGKTRKARNVVARGRATVLVLDPRADNAAWVSGSGPAELLEGADALEAGRTIKARNLTDLGRDEIGEVLERYDDSAIRVRPERWLAWDMTELVNTIAAHGVSLDRADDWFETARS